MKLRCEGTKQNGGLWKDKADRLNLLGIMRLLVFLCHRSAYGTANKLIINSKTVYIYDLTRDKLPLYSSSKHPIKIPLSCDGPRFFPRVQYENGRFS